MNRKIILLITLIMLSLITNACGLAELTPYEKLTEALNKLENIKSITIDMDMDIDANLNLGNIINDEQDIADLIPSELTLNGLIKIEYPKDYTEGDLTGMKASINYSLPIMGNNINIMSYIKDNKIYVSDNQGGYVFLDLSLQESADKAVLITDLTQKSFLLKDIGEDDFSVAAVTTSYRGADIESECFTIVLTEEKIKEYFDSLFLAKDIIFTEKNADILNSIIINDFEYKIYLNNDNEIIKVYTSFVINIDDTEKNDEKISVDYKAEVEIYDVDNTIVEYPDLSEAVEMSQ